MDYSQENIAVMHKELKKIQHQSNSLSEVISNLPTLFLIKTINGISEYDKVIPPFMFMILDIYEGIDPDGERGLESLLYLSVLEFLKRINVVEDYSQDKDFLSYSITFKTQILFSKDIRKIVSKAHNKFKRQEILSDKSVDLIINTISFIKGR